jgi:prohibitin 1
LLIFLPSLTGLRFVDAGEIGVVTRWGRVTGRLLDPGAHWVIPIAEGVLKYDTKLVVYETRKDNAQEYDKTYDEEASVYLDYPVDTNTKDGQQVNIYYTVRFSVDPTKASWIAQNIGSEDALVGKIVKTESRIWARNVPREYEAAQLYSGSTQEVQLKIAEKLRPVFEANGIILDEVGVREIKFSDQYVSAIESKQIEAVRVETEKNKAEQAKFQKEAAITQAEAQAEAQRLQKETLTPPLLQKLYLEKWDGHLPTYMLGSGQDLILNLPKGGE